MGVFLRLLFGDLVVKQRGGKKRHTKKKKKEREKTRRKREKKQGEEREKEKEWNRRSFCVFIIVQYGAKTNKPKFIKFFLSFFSFFFGTPIL